MRGLPPPPNDVVELEVDILVDQAPASISFWAFIPGLPGVQTSDLQAAFDLMVLYAVQLVTSLSSAATEVRTCRCRSFGDAPVLLMGVPASNHGAWGGSMAAMVACGIYWQTGEAGKRGHSITHVPGFPDDFTDDHLTVNDFGLPKVVAAAEAFAGQMNSISTGTVTSVTLGTLHRSRGGAPLGASVFAPIVGWTAVPNIARSVRRMVGRR